MTRYSENTCDVTFFLLFVVLFIHFSFHRYNITCLLHSLHCLRTVILTRIVHRTYVFHRVNREVAMSYVSLMFCFIVQQTDLIGQLGGYCNCTNETPTETTNGEHYVMNWHLDLWVFTTQCLKNT